MTYMLRSKWTYLAQMSSIEELDHIASVGEEESHEAEVSDNAGNNGDRPSGYACANEYLVHVEIFQNIEKCSDHSIELKMRKLRSSNDQGLSTKTESGRKYLLRE